MRIPVNKRLFWFLKDGTEVDLDNPAALETYVQQIVTHGNSSDVRDLIKTVAPVKLQASLKHLKGFLPVEVEKFWEDYFGSANRPAEGNS